jgi:hypothetical protein
MGPTGQNSGGHLLIGVRYLFCNRDNLKLLMVAAAFADLTVAFVKIDTINPCFAHVINVRYSPSEGTEENNRV